MRKNVVVCAPLVNIKKLFQFTYVKSPGNVFFCVCVCRDIAIKKCYFTWRWIKFFHSVCNWILMAIAIAEKSFFSLLLADSHPVIQFLLFLSRLFLSCEARERFYCVQFCGKCRLFLLANTQFFMHFIQCFCSCKNAFKEKAIIMQFLIEKLHIDTIVCVEIFSENSCFKNF